MTADPNQTLIEDETPTRLDGGAFADEPSRGGWRNVLAVIIAIALPIEIAWFAKHKDPWADSRQVVAALDAEGRAELAADWDRFQKLSSDEQKRLRQLHATIEADADPESLRTALADYEKWKSGLSPQQSATLVGLSPTERIDRVRTLSEEQSLIAARALSPADMKTVIGWLEGEVDKIQDKLMGLVPQPARERLEALGRRERNIMLILAALNWRGGAGSVGPRFEALSLQSLVELRERLSPEAQNVWDAARSMEERKLLLAEWIRQAATKTYGSRDGVTIAQRIGNMELQKFFENELTDAERDRLVALPREEMAMQLKQEYVRRRGLKEGLPGGFRPQPKPPVGEKRPFVPGALGGDRRLEPPPKPRSKGPASDEKPAK